MEIEFRGISLKNSQFVYGDLFHRINGDIYINTIVQFSEKTRFNKQIQVIPETVGQYTGLKDKKGIKIFHNDIIKVKSKHYFNSELMNEFKELKKLDSLNGIGLHFIGVVKLDLFRGLMFENPKNGYQEPIFTRHIDIKINHGGIEVIGNIHQNKELLE